MRTIGTATIGCVLVATLVATAAGCAASKSNAPPAAEPALKDDVLSALVNLGYHRPLAEHAVAAVLKAAPDGGFERTLKQALRELAK